MGLVGELQRHKKPCQEHTRLCPKCDSAYQTIFVNLAEVVSMVSYLLHMTSNFPENQRLPATALNTVLAAFVRAVRKEMSWIDTNRRA